MRGLASAVLIGLLALLLAACGGDSGSEDGVVEITFWHGQSEETAEELEKLIDEFNRTHPKIRVSKDAGGVQADQLLTKVTAGLASGSYPDIAYIFGPDLASVTRSPKVVDLTETVKGPGWNWDTFWKAERDAATVDGKVRAIPALADVLAVIYNKKLLADAGVEPPDETTTWDDFGEIAKATTDESEGTFGTAWPGVGGEDTVWRLWPLVWQRGGEIVTPDGSKIGFDNESGLGALETVRKLAVVDKSVYVDPDPSSDRTGQLFQNGKLAMWLAGPWALLDVKVSGVEAGVAPLPVYEGDHTSIAGPDNWVVFDNGSARTRAAEEFLRWFTAPEQDLKWAQVTGQLPVRESTTKLPGFDAYTKEWPGTPTFIDAIRTGRSRPTIRNYPRMSEAVGRGIVSVLLDKASPADALQTVTQEANEALAAP